MTYDEFIQNIINTRGQWNIPEGEYWEGHHIVPKCLGGMGKCRSKHPNIIWLYPQEHYEAHKLLALENSNNKQLVYAWSAMALPSSSRGMVNISTEDFGSLRRLQHETQLEFYKDPKNRAAVQAKCTAKRAIYCINTEEHFESISAAARKYNIFPISKISSAIKYKCRAGGYYWCYDIETDINNLKDYLQNYVFKKHKCPMSEAERCYRSEMAIEHRSSWIAHWTEEARKKASLTSATNKSVICIETGVVYRSLTEAKQAIGLKSISSITNCLRGNAMTAGGYHWKYFMEEDNDV